MGMNMKRRSRRNMLSKERFIMVASSALVLVSLTATGLWLGKDTKAQEEDYVVDLTEIENKATTGFNNEVPSDDLDYDPYFQETNSQNVENPDQSESASMSEGAHLDKQYQEDSQIQSQEAAQGATQEAAQETALETSELEADDTQALSTAMQPALNFSDADSLVWPIVGNVLVNYSMDKTVYFPTLEQYKYNPAIIIEANEGDLITASAAGKVTSVFTDPQIGNAVTMELGSGYEITYGQLTNILVSEGSYVAMGDVIAEVAAPTKYYSVEGTNVYFKLTQNGEPVNPMTKLS